MVKNFEDMFIRFDMIHERDRRTDGHRMTAYDVGTSQISVGTRCKHYAPL